MRRLSIPLVLAPARDSSCANLRCACIPTLRRLVGSLVREFPAVANPQAAARAVIGGEAELCVTNHHAVERYDLRVVRRLKHMRILWLVFRCELVSS